MGRARDLCGNALKQGDVVVWFARDASGTGTGTRTGTGTEAATLATVEAVRYDTDDADADPEIRLLFRECYVCASDPLQTRTRVARSPWLRPCAVLLPAAANIVH